MRKLGVFTRRGREIETFNEFTKQFARYCYHLVT